MGNKNDTSFETPDEQTVKIGITRRTRSVTIVIPAVTEEERLRTRIAELETSNGKLAQALAFARNCILSGESWDKTCDLVIGGALGHAAISTPLLAHRQQDTEHILGAEENSTMASVTSAKPPHCQAQKPKMAKIVYRGQPKPKIFRHKCKACDSVVEFTDKDVQLDYIETEYVICPVCKGITYSRKNKTGI